MSLGAVLYSGGSEDQVDREVPPIGVRRTFKPTGGKAVLLQNGVRLAVSTGPQFGFQEP